MSSFDELLKTIRSKSVLIATESDGRIELGALFLRAIRQTMMEIHRGAESDDFADLVIVNLIILGAKEGYKVSEIKDFIEQLKSENDELESE
jgi:hypothetical protein